MGSAHRGLVPGKTDGHPAAASTAWTPHILVLPKNRVARFGRYRVRRSPSDATSKFRATLGDGRRFGGMLFPGDLIWDDDPPPRRTRRAAR